MPEPIRFVCGIAAPSFERQVERQGLELFDGERQEYARAFNSLQVLVCHGYISQQVAAMVCDHLAARVAFNLGGGANG